jgi:hypothetical protein
METTPGKRSIKSKACVNRSYCVESGSEVSGLRWENGI